MAAARLFVAISPPAAVRVELGALAAPLAGVRWTPPDNLHLTLRFIGDTEPEKQARLEAALARVQVEPFILPVGGIGLFPTRGPAKVMWAGVGNAHPRLFQLRKQVDEALLSVDMTLDVHNFHPHFTLGRPGVNHEPKTLAKFLERHAAFEAPPFRVGEFHLMASEQPTGLLRQGDEGQGRAPVYCLVRTYPLQPK
jgi:2'-5' RNA ligase